MEYADVYEHSDDGEDEGDVDEDNELQTSVSVDKFSIPLISLVDSTRYYQMSMGSVALPTQPAGLEFPDMSLQSTSSSTDDDSSSFWSFSSFSLDEDTYIPLLQ